MSEPNWVGYVSDDIESELTRSQEDSLGETERQRIVVESGLMVLLTSDLLLKSIAWTSESPEA